MITQFAQQYLVSLNHRGVQIFGRTFPSRTDAGAWEQDAYDAIDSGQPLPDDRDPKYHTGLEKVSS